MALLALSVPGCGRAPSPAQAELRLVFAVAPESLDPQRHSEDVTRSVLSNFYDGLVGFDEGLAIRPRLAVTWTNPDERRWRFRLRPGVTFHDGTPFGPEDVIRTVERARVARGSRVDADVRSIVAATKVDAETVELVTDRVRPLLLAKLAQTPILPRTAGDAEIESPVGTGPYRFAGASRDRKAVRGKRWDRYWGPAPAFDAFVAEAVTGEAALARTARGGAGVVSPLPPDAVREGRAPGSVFRSVVSPTLTVSFLVCRLGPLVGGAPSPFRDARVRRALDLALDRERLVAEGLGGEGQALRQLAVRGVHGFDPSLAVAPSDAAASRRLLAEAGFAGGLESTLTVSGRGRALGEVIARQILPAGFRLAVVPAGWPDILERMRDGRAPLALASWTHATGDASGLFEPVLHSAGGERGLGAENTTGYAIPEVDGMIERAAGEMEPVVRAELLRLVMRRALEDLPLVPLYSVDWSYAIRRDLTFSPRLDLSVAAADVKPAPPPR